MTRFRSIVLVLIACLFVGCQYKAPLMSTPVDVSGKLTKDGKPMGNVTLMLQPLETGHMVPLSVGADGSFKGTIVPGKYAFYLAAKEDGSSNLSGIDNSLMQASMDRTVTVQQGQAQLEVAL